MNKFIFINIITLIFIVILSKIIFDDFTIGTCLILAGGIGNVIDRIFRGFVVDYIDITGIINFPIFNLADILIVLGIAIFRIQILKKE